MGRGVTWAVVAAVAAMTAVGCASAGDGGALAEAPAAGAEAKRLSAYAAGARFPEALPASDELKVTAVVDRKEHTITLRNFGDVALKEPEVWVNGRYVRRVPALPARGGLVIHFGQFYNGRGTSLEAARDVTVSRVQLRAGKKLYNALGPAYE